MLTRSDLDLDDLTVTLSELALGTPDAPLVWLAEGLIARLRIQDTGAGFAQLAGQLLAVMKELRSGREATAGPSKLDQFRDAR